jgi:hypothetical protein
LSAISGDTLKNDSERRVDHVACAHHPTIDKRSRRRALKYAAYSCIRDK